MDVQTVEERSFSIRSSFFYSAIVLLLIGFLLAPTTFLPSYPRLLHTIVLAVLVGLVARTIFSAVVSFSRIEPPALTLSDDELPFVSVVIPAFNEESVLPGTIEACKQVDYPRDKLEVILCYEAASTDRTAEICEQAAAKDSIFRAIERDEPGGGKAKATNFALQFASGEIIASIDADHHFKGDAIKRAVAWFEVDHDLWCLKGRCYGRNPSDSLLALHATVERHIAEKADLFARHVLNGFTIFGGGQAFFRRAVFEELGEFDEAVLVEDIDMSSKIHLNNKRLVMDPGVITFEENPATFGAWWSQRKRWARGWMQVAVRYLGRFGLSSAIPLRKRLDAVYTFANALSPVLLILVFPLTAVQLTTAIPTETYVPNAWVIWTVITIAPALVSYLIFWQDYRDGLSHHLYEYVAAFTLWFYLVFQIVVFLTAFIEEFILSKPSVYVTTSRSGQNE